MFLARRHDAISHPPFEMPTHLRPSASQQHHTPSEHCRPSKSLHPLITAIVRRNQRPRQRRSRQYRDTHNREPHTRPDPQLHRIRG